MASTHGPNDVVTPKVWARPAMAATPSARSATNWPTRRLLPTPASARTSTTRNSPAAARASSASRASVSVSRPTSRGPWGSGGRAPRLGADEAGLLRAGDVAEGEARIGQVGQDPAPPQAERLPEDGGRRPVLAPAAGVGGPAAQRLEAQGVDLVGGHGQDVAARPGEQGVGPTGTARPQRPPQPGHVDLQRRQRLGRRVSGP